MQSCVRVCMCACVYVYVCVYVLEEKSFENVYTKTHSYLATSFTISILTDSITTTIGTCCTQCKITPRRKIIAPTPPNPYMTSEPAHAVPLNCAYNPTYVAIAIITQNDENAIKVIAKSRDSCFCRLLTLHNVRIGALQTVQSTVFFAECNFNRHSVCTYRPIHAHAEKSEHGSRQI